ncbi:hypothetical protein EZ55_03937 [Alteromonas macleodii]|nr:hypothetical protein EZ55_03937 [Alteromonas macleodii]VTP57846.1 hypothetical protein EZ55_03937 [Alteromonas macleodii]
MSSREESKEIAFLLKNGDWAFPVTDIPHQIQE